MATIAKSSITLVSISDAYSVSLQPSNITINADPYGNNPKLENAFTIISLYCGDIQVPISSAKVVGSSLWVDDALLQKRDYSLEIVGDSVKLSIISVGNQLSGWREIEVLTNAGQKITARFSYTVVRETTMLDWILEWDKNLTEISGDHVATPNAFIGNRDGEGKLTGVYIGGGENHPYLPGIYGFKGCTPEAFAQGNLGSTEIFHLNETGGMIGGWDISNIGLIKENSVGRLEILSEGTIRYVNILDATTPFWELKNDGTGSLANGHISWNTDGSATFDGEIRAQSGNIGGWRIGKDSLYNQMILINSSSRFIGIRNSINMLYIGEPTTGSFYNDITKVGGIAMFYTDTEHYGMEGWKQGIGRIDGNGIITYSKGSKIFSLGSDNRIADWTITTTALYRGSYKNTAGTFTNASGDITIGSQGIRGWKWYIDADGEADFMQGRVHLGPSKCEIAGWTIEENRLCTPKAALVNDTNYAGLFLSTVSFGASEGALLTDKISSLGGIYLVTSGNHAELAAYSGSDTLLFKLTSSGTSQIASWKFNNKRIYIGVADLIPGNNFTAYPDSLVLSDKGVHAPQWCLLANGSGKLAGGNISWDVDGNVTFANSVKLAWTQITGTDGVMTKATYIDANGIFTGKINATNITTGTLSSERINTDELLSNGEKWALLKDGSGFLAGNLISWTDDGILSIKGTLYQPWVERIGSSYAVGDEEYIKTFEKEKYGWTNLCVHPNDLAPGNLLHGESSDNNGRLVRLLNTYTTNVTLNAGTGWHFFEDGMTTDKLHVFAGEIVELIGYSQNGDFKGWFVLNRKDIATGTAYGHPASSLARGRISGNNGVSSLGRYSTFDGSDLSLTDSKNGAQWICKINIPEAWKLIANAYNIQLTMLGENSNIKVLSISSTAIELSMVHGSTCMFDIVPIGTFSFPSKNA